MQSVFLDDEDDGVGSRAVVAPLCVREVELRDEVGVEAWMLHDGVGVEH